MLGLVTQKDLTGVLDVSDFCFFPFQCVVEIGSLRGWNCFWPFLWSWVSPLRFAKWTGSIRGQQGARGRVLLKGDGRKTTWSSPPCFPPFFQPHCPATEGQWHVPTVYGSAAYLVAAAQSKQARWWRGCRMCTEASVTDTRARLPPRPSAFQPEAWNSQPQSAVKSPDKVQFPMFYRVNMAFSKVSNEVWSKRWAHKHLLTHLECYSTAFQQMINSRVTASNITSYLYAAFQMEL